MGFLKVTDPKSGRFSIMGESNQNFLLKYNSKQEAHRRYKLERIDAETYEEALEKCGIAPTETPATTAKSKKKDQ